MFRAAVLSSFVAVSFPVASEDVCPPPPVVEYFSAETEESIPREEIVGVWFVEEVIVTPTDTGIVYGLFISEAIGVEYEIDTAWIAEAKEGGTEMLTLEEIEARYEAMTMN